MYGGSGTWPQARIAASTGSPDGRPERDLEQPVVVGAAEQADHERGGPVSRAARAVTSTSAPNLSGLLALPSARQTSAARTSPGATSSSRTPDAPDEEDLDPPAGVALPAEEARRDDARVVDDDERPGGEQVRQLGDAPVLGRGRRRAAAPAAARARAPRRAAAR